MFGKEGKRMDDKMIQMNMEKIIAALKEAGYDPYEQLVGYLQTGQEYYITRRNGARDMVRLIDKEQIKKYITNNIRNIK